MGFFDTLLKNQSVIILDSAMGTELKEREADISGPLWSAKALIDSPDTVRAIHIDNLDAGADIITTNTFRTNRRTFEKAGYHFEDKNFSDSANELTKAAVELAQDAVMLSDNDAGIVAGCIAPVEDCYRPDLVPDTDTLCTEHFEHCRNLVEAGANILIAETMGTIREISAVLNQIHKFGKEFIFSLLCKNDNELYSGELLSEAVSIINKYSPNVLAVNCIHPKLAEPLIRNLKTMTEFPIGVYANVGEEGKEVNDEFKVTISPKDYFHYAKKWKELGVRLIGGCCGTNPDYIKKLKSLK